MKKKHAFLVMLACLLALGLAFVGCDNGNGNGDDNGGTPANVVGTWELKLTEAQWDAMPDSEDMKAKDLKDMDVEFPMLVAELEFKADGTYESWDYNAKKEQKSEAERGTYTVSGNTVTLTATWQDDPDDPGPSTLTYSSGKLTFKEGSQTLAFTKK